MNKLPLWFLVAAAACLVAGVMLGIVMGMLHDFHLAPVHAHLNLLGWTSLALMGLTYRAFPELMARRGLALTQFWLSAGSAMAFPLGIWLSVERGWPGLAILAGFVWLAGALLFLVRLVTLSLSEPAALPPRTRQMPSAAE
jgi:cbb3-type cytochrome oxidase subunit 1